MAVAAAILSSILTVVLLSFVRPAAVPDALSGLGLATIGTFVVGALWFAVNLAAAPHRFWREGSDMLEHLHVLELGMRVTIVESIMATTRELSLRKQPISDQAVRYDKWEAGVGELLRLRPDDLAEFQRPVAFEEAATDQLARFYAHMEAKRSRLLRIAEKVEAERVPLPSRGRST